MLNKIIFYSFCLLFLFTPLFWYSGSFELFEYNKMILTYAITVVIVGIWIIRMINQKSLIFNRTPLDIPLILFLISQIVSTYFSIDQHTSIFGYYSRSNGGLLSIISYLLLYWALVSNLDKTQVINLLKSALVGGLLVSLWAIPEHFGVSPSCVLLRGEFSADCWIQDVQARVFATLGQPNWLAAYLAMLIFPAMYFFLKAKSFEEKIFAYSFVGAFYLAFTFTYSRGATFGLIAGMGVFILLSVFGSRLSEFSSSVFSLSGTGKQKTGKHDSENRKLSTDNWKPLALLLGSFIAINILFGSALTRFELSKIFTKPAPQVETTIAPALTQLENGGTESGKIRLIVWSGALDIFKNYPLFGSGVETFAYSYYNFRPQAHNLVSEWDFLYNKAHNEFLNYLATTGIFGFVTYMLVIGYFVFSSTRFLVTSKPANEQALLLIALLASYISYLIQNIFGFSVVIVAIFFFTFPAIFYVISGSTRLVTKNLLSSSQDLATASYLSHSLLVTLLSRPIFAKGLQIIVGIAMIFFLVNIFYLWYADTLFAKGQKYSQAGNIGQAYNYLSQAVVYNNNEPYYKSELGYAAAAAAASLKDEDATFSAMLKDQGILETERALKISPKNVSYFRTAILTNYQLSTLDPTFMQKTIDTIDQTLKLAPTDAKLFYNKAVLLGQMDENDKAIESLNKAIGLKPNYREAYVALALFLFDAKKYPEAVENMQKVLQLVPNDLEAMQYLNDWGKEGIATNSVQQK